MDNTPSTLTQTLELMVVVIGGPDTLVHAVRRVAATHIGAGVAVATVTDAATVVAENRPFAILVSAELHALDPPEFGALARDVRARLMSVDTHERSPKQIADTITPLLLAAEKVHARG